MMKATLAGGCFWCTEAIFKRLKGVRSVAPGYAGGKVANPTYEQVCNGKTGHAESIQIEYDEKILPYEKLLDIFWNTHDPTTKDRQGNDIGPEYRSIIFYHNGKQRNVAEQSLQRAQKLFDKPIVTEIIPFTNFYAAEDYHKNYYENHKGALYCDLVISPKIKKLLAKYGNDVKEEYKNA